MPPLNRTWVNSLRNVSSPTANDGSVWAKESVIHVYDDVDAALASQDAKLAIPVCILQNSSVQNWGSGVWANIPFGNDLYDPLNMHTGGDFFVYLPTAGVYCVNATIAWPSNATGTRGIVAQANGGFNFPYTGLVEQATANFVGRLNALVQIVNTASYLSLQLYQDSGVSLNFPIGAIRCEVTRVAT